MVASFNCRHIRLTIIVCYEPTNSETRSDDVENKDAFYNQLDDPTTSTPKHDVQIVIRDMNVQLGNDTSTWSPVLGNRAEVDFNDNSIRLLSFFQAHNLLVGSSLFSHKRIHKGSFHMKSQDFQKSSHMTLLNFLLISLKCYPYSQTEKSQISGPCVFSFSVAACES